MNKVSYYGLLTFCVIGFGLFFSWKSDPKNGQVTYQSQPKETNNDEYLYGYTLLKNVTTGVPEGTKIHNRKGGYYGTVVGYDGNHTFPNGEVDVAVQIQLSDNEETKVWMISRVVDLTFYKKD